MNIELYLSSSPSNFPCSIFSYDWTVSMYSDLHKKDSFVNYCSTLEELNQTWNSTVCSKSEKKKQLHFTREVQQVPISMHVSATKYDLYDLFTSLLFQPFRDKIWKKKRKNDTVRTFLVPLLFYICLTIHNRDASHISALFCLVFPDDPWKYRA